MLLQVIFIVLPAYIKVYENMNNSLSFITNEENQSLKDRFTALIKDTAFFDCLVGYFYSSDFYAVYPALEKTDKIRILIGIRTNRQTFDMMEKANKRSQQVFDFSHAETKQTAKNTLKALNGLDEELINPFKVLAVLQTHIPERLLQSHYAEQNPAISGRREVILSLYLKGE